LIGQILCRKDTLLILLPIVIRASSARDFPSSCIRPKSLKFLVICKVITVFIQKDSIFIFVLVVENLNFQIHMRIILVHSLMFDFLVIFMHVHKI